MARLTKVFVPVLALIVGASATNVRKQVKGPLHHVEKKAPATPVITAPTTTYTGAWSGCTGSAQPTCTGNTMTDLEKCFADHRNTAACQTAGIFTITADSSDLERTACNSPNGFVFDLKKKIVEDFASSSLDLSSATVQMTKFDPKLTSATCEAQGSLTAHESLSATTCQRLGMSLSASGATVAVTGFSEHDIFPGIAVTGSGSCTLTAVPNQGATATASIAFMPALPPWVTAAVVSECGNTKACPAAVRDFAEARVCMDALALTCPTGVLTLTVASAGPKAGECGTSNTRSFVFTDSLIRAAEANDIDLNAADLQLVKFEPGYIGNGCTADNLSFYPAVEATCAIPESATKLTPTVVTNTLSLVAPTNSQIPLPDSLTLHSTACTFRSPLASSTPTRPLTSKITLKVAEESTTEDESGVVATLPLSLTVAALALAAATF